MVSKAQVQNANGPGMGRRGRHPVRGQRGCGDRRRSEQMQAGRSQDSLCSGHMQWVSGWHSGQGAGRPQPLLARSPPTACAMLAVAQELCFCDFPKQSPASSTGGHVQRDPWIPGRGRRPGSATVSAHGTRRVHHSSTQLCSAASMFHATAQPTLQSGITVRSHTATQVAAAGPQGPACPRAPRQSGACGGPLAPSPSGLPWTVGPVPLSPVLAAVQTRTCSLAGHRRLVGARPASHTAKPPGRMPHEHACV